MSEQPNAIPLAKMSDINAHTPGPWVMAHRKGVLAVRGAATEHVAQISSVFQVGYGPTSSEEARCNARLIAAAPDMLAALVAIEARHEDEDRAEAEGSFTEAWLALREQARAAIARATAS